MDMTKKHSRSRLRTALLAACAVGAALLSGAAEFYVATSGDNSDGSSWANAYTTLQAAINAAGPGDTIYVKGETFTLTAPNPATGKLYWGPDKYDLTIIGGYQGIGPEPGPATNTATVLRNTAAGIYTTNRVLFATGVTNGILRNVTIQGGQIGWSNPQTIIPYHLQGAGVHLTGCTNMLFSDVVIQSNYLYGQQNGQTYGAGLYAVDSYGTFSNCLFRGNWLQRFASNMSYGGGLHLSGGGWLLRDCTIRDNTTAYQTVYGDTCRGVGIYINNGTHTLKNCLITRNIGPSNSSPQGEGVYVENGTVTLENCTLYWQRQEGLRRANGTVTLRNSIAWANGANVVGTVTRVNSAVQGLDSAADPQFDRGLFLAPSSPYHDAGSMTADEAGLTGYTVRTDGTADSGNVAIGYHFPPGTAVVDYFVDADNGLDSNNGLTAGSAFKTITKALSMIGDGSRVHVAAGLYNLANGEAFPLSVANKYGIQILGAGQDDTIIDANDANQRCLGLSYIYPDARVSGLTLKRGRLTTGSSRGGGLYLYGVQGLIDSCNLVENVLPNPNGWGAPAGAGLTGLWCDAVVSNCVIRGNTATSWYPENCLAAGVYAVELGTIANCTIISNTATTTGDASWHPHTYGGGLYLERNNTVRNSLIAWNDAKSSNQTTPHGDGVYVAGDLSGWSVVIENCTVISNHPAAHARYNSSSTEGIGIEKANIAPTVTVRNSILWNNGDEILNGGGGAITLRYSNIEDGDAGTGCISEDPQFVDAAAGNWRLQRTSTSVNAGEVQTWMDGATDLDGNPRVLNKIVDMGAYEILIPAGGTVFVVR